MEFIDKEKKKDLIIDIKKELIEGSFEKAVKIQRDSILPVSEITSIATTVFTELCSQDKYERAIELAKFYNLSSEKIIEAIMKGFSHFFIKGEYEKAANWGLEYKLSSSEILKATVRIFEKLISEKDIKSALQAVEKYNIPHESIMDSASSAFNDAYRRKDYLSAAILGKEFNLPKKRILTAAVNAFKGQILKENWDGLIAVENEFNILSDSAFNDIQERERESAIDVFFKNAIQENIKRGRGKIVIHILESTGILSRRYSEVILKELMNDILLEITRLHNLLLTKGDEKDALQIKDHFEFLKSDAPVDVKASVVETAQSYHNVLLKRYQFEEAKNIKKEYGLFDKNILADSVTDGLTATFEFLKTAISKDDLITGMEVVKEYKISKDKIAEIATKIIIDKLNKLDFENAFLILRKFNINPYFEPLQTEAQKQFSDNINNNHFEIAAEIGKIFKLNAKETRVSAYKAWERHIRNARYDKAFQFKKEYKLPTPWTKNVAREIYEYNIQISRTDAAKRIRSEYEIDYNFFDLVKEFIKKYLFRK